MAEILKERVCAEVEGEFVVFLIGMRISKLWKVSRWMPAFLAMPKMLRELDGRPDLGLLSARSFLQGRTIGVTQYWRSVELLQAYAHGQDHLHLLAWRRFNASVGTSGDVGIWHETYVVPAGNAESVYVNMPRYGLGQAGTVFPAKGHRANAAKRLGRGKSPPQAA